MRGRPPLRMTHRRRQVLEEITAASRCGEPVTLARLARRCGLYDYREARRLLSDLRRIAGGPIVEWTMKTVDKESVDRFWARLDKTPGHGPQGNCWLWTGPVTETGYPRRFSWDGRTFQASHIAMMIDGRPCPKPGLFGLHSCDVKLCCNPAHLRWGTDEENYEDFCERGILPNALPKETVIEILTSPERNFEVARRLGITQSAVCNIRKGRTHKRIHEIYSPAT